MFKPKFRIRQTTILTCGLLAVLCGLGFARTHIVLPPQLIVLAVIWFAVSVVRLRFMAVLSMIILGFVIGWWRGQIYMHELRPLLDLDGQHVVAIVQADTDAVYNERSQLSFDASRIRISDPIDQTLPGRIKVSGFGEPAVYKGDVVQIEGKVYVSRGSRQLSMGFADMKVLGRSSSVVDSVRRKFSAGMTTALPEPLASFGMGILIGQKSTLPENISQSLSVVGLTHIIAVSGYNLTIIMRSVRRLLHKRSKYQSTVLSVALILTFLLVTGFSASIVRAALVSLLSLAAWYHGRQFRPVLLIALTAAMTALWNPLYIWSDIGWYLSFLAFFGVLVLAPLISRRLFAGKEPKVLTAVLIETLSALVMTVPLILYIFHQVSLVAIFANVLIVPLVPLAMLFALIAGLAGMFMPLLAGVFALPATWLLTYMLDLVTVIARVPHILVERSISLPVMLFLYGCILCWLVVLWRKASKNVTITDKNPVF